METRLDNEPQAGCKGIPGLMPRSDSERVGDGRLDRIAKGDFSYSGASSAMAIAKELQNFRRMEKVWRHLVKRMYDECGATKADEFIRRVESGEHDVETPWSRRQD